MVDEPYNMYSTFWYISNGWNSSCTIINEL